VLPRVGGVAYDSGMPESVDQWWERRQWSKGVDVPYPVGTYREDWARYPVLIRQYHPDLNHGVTLTQIPPAADVLLLWVCDLGHRFVATPEEQRQRPGGSRRRSTWCPDCAALAVRGRAPVQVAAQTPPHACGHPVDPRRIAPDDAGDRCALCRRLDSAPVTREELLELVTPGRRSALAAETRVDARYAWACPAGHGAYESTVEKVVEGRRCPTCRHARAGADAVPIGEAFVSRWAPKPASAAEADLRRRIANRLAVDLTTNAVRVARPFFHHVEVWPDILLPELKVAIEYDTVGRDGLEHVGRREEVDRKKDRLLRAVGWEVIRIRVGRLLPIGPFDIITAGVSAALIDRILDRIAEARGQLLVAAYLRDPAEDGGAGTNGAVAASRA
jgi:very-short-patch-repair endonuclease